MRTEPSWKVRNLESRPLTIAPETKEGLYFVQTSHYRKTLLEETNFSSRTVSAIISKNNPNNTVLSN